MHQKAVIFDMDGLLIDTNQIWRNAEQAIFSSVGIDVTDEHAAITCSMSTSESTQYWFNQKPWTGHSLKEIEQAVIERVSNSISASDCSLPGVDYILHFFSRRQFKIGLATNAPKRLAHEVLEKLSIIHFFEAICSADEVCKGKPSADVYLYAAKKLEVTTSHCIAFEDSLPGLISAKAAGMFTVAVTDPELLSKTEGSYADILIPRLDTFNENMLVQLMRDTNGT